MTITATAPQLRTTSDAPACSANPDLFQHRLLEEPPSAAQLNAGDRRLASALRHRAEALCLECPLMTRCLYDAVVKHDVAGYVAGTTQKQRQQMRALLGVKVAPEDLDTLAGVFGPNRQVDHAEILRLRAVNPHESLEQLAQRLGCSLSTVKRHLRRARQEEAPTLTAVLPSVADVLDAYAEVTRPSGPTRTQRRAA